MEIIQCVENDRGKIRIVFESGWKVWLNRNDSPGFPLTEGTQVDRTEFEKYILLHQYPSALDRAVRMLAERPCSKREIETRLTRARFSNEVTELVLYKLEKEKLLNDRDFAEQWTLSRSRKYGYARIRQELLIKGIDAETAESVLDSLSEDDQMENAVSFAARKIRSMSGTCETAKVKQRTAAALVRRGFSWDIALKAYEKAACEEEKT